MKPDVLAPEDHTSNILGFETNYDLGLDSLSSRCIIKGDDDINSGEPRQVCIIGIT